MESPHELHKENHITLSEFISQSEKGKSILVLTADWIPTSEIVKIVISKLKKQLPGINFLLLNIENQNDLILHFRVKKFPTTFFFNNKEIVHRFEGVFSKKDIIQFNNTVW